MEEVRPSLGFRPIEKDSKPTERIVLRKIYVWRAALFGLAYGFFLGLVLVIPFYIVMIMTGESYFSDVSGINSLILESTFIFSFIILFFYTLISGVMFAISALVYNLISKTGLRIHLGLAEYN